MNKQLNDWMLGNLMILVLTFLTYVLFNYLLNISYSIMESFGIVTLALLLKHGIDIIERK